MYSAVSSRWRAANAVWSCSPSSPSRAIRTSRCSHASGDCVRPSRHMTPLMWRSPRGWGLSSSHATRESSRRRGTRRSSSSSRVARPPSARSIVHWVDLGTPPRRHVPRMNWITIICSMIAASCLTVAGIHLLVWLRSRQAWTNLLLSNCALTAAVIVAFNIGLMHADSPARAAWLLRWMYLPLTWGLISLMLFARQYLGAGRTWLLWCVVGFRALAL